jgi:hypothetical protein
MRKTLLALAVMTLSTSVFAQTTEPTSSPPTPTGSPTGGMPNPVAPTVGPSGIENKGLPQQGTATPQNGTTATVPPAGTRTQSVVPNANSVDQNAVQAAPNSVDQNTASQTDATLEVPRLVPNSIPEAVPNSSQQAAPNSTAQGNCGWACQGTNCQPVGCSGPPASSDRQASH